MGDATFSTISATFPKRYPITPRPTCYEIQPIISVIPSIKLKSTRCAVSGYSGRLMVGWISLNIWYAVLIHTKGILSQDIFCEGSYGWRSHPRLCSFALVVSGGRGYAPGYYHPVARQYRLPTHVRTVASSGFFALEGEQLF